MTTEHPRKRGRSAPTGASLSKHVVLDNPCWGDDLHHSLSHLLSRIKRHDCILYESRHYVVLNKPPDLRMDGPYPATLLKLLSYWYPPPSLRQGLNEQDDNYNEALLQRVARLAKHSDLVDNELRPCHQLDYATSGVLLVARSQAAAHAAMLAFEARSVHKTYVALLHGHVNVDSCAWPWQSRAHVIHVMEGAAQTYGQQRRRPRPDTFAGYMPPHALWQQYQRHHNASMDSNATGNKKSKLKRPRQRALTLSETDWERVWNTLQLSAAAREELQQHQIKFAFKQLSVEHQQAFGRAAILYNDLVRARIESHDANVYDHAIPLVTRLVEDKDAFCVAAPLAQVPDDFAMRIPAAIFAEAATARCRSGGRLLVGDDTLDYKPAWTECRVIAHGYLATAAAAAAASDGGGEKEHVLCPVTKVQMHPCTGRRHQLRVHMALIGHAIVGDQTYQDATADGGASACRMCLHASHLTISHLPETIDVKCSDPFAMDAQGLVQVSEL